MDYIHKITCWPGCWRSLGTQMDLPSPFNDNIDIIIQKFVHPCTIANCLHVHVFDG